MLHTTAGLRGAAGASDRERLSQSLQYGVPSHSNLASLFRARPGDRGVLQHKYWLTPEGNIEFRFTFTSTEGRNTIAMVARAVYTVNTSQYSEPSVVASFLTDARKEQLRAVLPYGLHDAQDLNRILNRFTLLPQPAESLARFIAAYNFMRREHSSYNDNFNLRFAEHMAVHSTDAAMNSIRNNYSSNVRACNYNSAQALVLTLQDANVDFNVNQ